MDLKRQLKNFSIVIQYEKSGKLDDTIKRSIESLSSYGVIYYAILHNLDLDKDDTSKYKHFHVVLSLQSRQRGSTILNLISELCGLSDDCISVMPCASVAIAVQYLIHKNDKQKHQYLPSYIFSNAPQTNIIDLLNTDITLEKLDFATLERLYKESNYNLLTLMKKIGLSRYNTYQRTIKEFIKLYDLYKPHCDIDEISDNDILAYNLNDGEIIKR